MVGNLFVPALLRAADRGVRVRILLDDIFTKGYDAGMIALDSHSNLEIRIFNSFRRGVVGRSIGAALDFSRINRRMHVCGPKRIGELRRRMRHWQFRAQGTDVHTARVVEVACRRLIPR